VKKSVYVATHIRFLLFTLWIGTTFTVRSAAKYRELVNIKKLVSRFVEETICEMPFNTTHPLGAKAVFYKVL